PRSPGFVIFDCDGVLVDSEPITNRIFGEMLAGLGLRLTPDEQRDHFLGRTMDDCVRLIEELTGRDVPASFVPTYRQRIRKVLAEEVEPVEGVVDLVKKLTLPSCVASSGTIEKMHVTLGRTGLLPYFDGRLVSATDVAHGKPAPDVFLLAAERFDVDPATCLVIEDSPNGVMAARAAGMMCIGYAGETPAGHLGAAGADMVVQEMADVALILKL
ncbi:MAG: HAD family phosphatase, partial [Bacteroidota bacterium]